MKNPSFTSASALVEREGLIRFAHPAGSPFRDFLNGFAIGQTLFSGSNPSPSSCERPKMKKAPDSSGAFSCCGEGGIRTLEGC